MHTWAVRGWAIDRGRLVFQVVCICVGLNMQAMEQGYTLAKSRI